MSIQCLICGSSQQVDFLDEYKLEIKGDKKYFYNSKIYRCDDCDFSFVYPIPEKDKLDYFYEYIYRSNERPPFFLEENYEDQKKHYLEDKNLSYLSYLTTLIDIRKVQELYDFGSGYGDLGYSLKLKFPKINLSCSENDVFCKKILEDRDYKNYKDINEINGKFDIIISLHSLEHLTDVNFILSKFNDLLVKVGYMFFEVPNCTSEYWRGRPYDSPHLLFFTKKSLEILANKHGFQFINLSTSSYSFELDHTYQRESQGIYEDGISSFFSLFKIKKILKKFIPKKIISFRQDFNMIKTIRNNNKLNWFVNNVGNNCYIRGILKK